MTKSVLSQQGVLEKKNGRSTVQNSAIQERWVVRNDPEAEQLSFPPDAEIRVGREAVLQHLREKGVKI